MHALFVFSVRNSAAENNRPSSIFHGLFPSVLYYALCFVQSFLAILEPVRVDENIDGFL